MLRTVDLKIRKKEPAHRPGSVPVKRRPEVKFKLTIQSENLRFNSKYFTTLKLIKSGKNIEKNIKLKERYLVLYHYAE